MAMKGFDPRWKDLPDYILGITKEIWEDRGIATLHGYYGRDMLKRGSRGHRGGRAGGDRRDHLLDPLAPDLHSWART
jgi:hypothetical protein